MSTTTHSVSLSPSRLSSTEKFNSNWQLSGPVTRFPCSCSVITGYNKRVGAIIFDFPQPNGISLLPDTEAGKSQAVRPMLELGSSSLFKIFFGVCILELREITTRADLITAVEVRPFRVDKKKEPRARALARSVAESLA